MHYIKRSSAEGPITRKGENQRGTGDKLVNDEKNRRPWLGYIILTILLVILSIIAFILSTLEGFLAGVMVIFMGFVLSFFRDDLRRILGISKGKQVEQVQPAPTPEQEKETLDELMLDKLERDITKGREKVEKLISKFEHADKEKKKSKIARDIVENCTRLIATIDQAKSQSIRRKDSALQSHFDGIADEIEAIRTKYRSFAEEPA